MQEQLSESQETPQETQRGEQGESQNILNPEGIAMLMIAGILDLLSTIPFFNFVTDIVGVCIIGLWLLIRGKRPATKTSFRKSPWTRRITASIGELIPGVSMLPLWTILVYSELKS